jgi:hypothetical protein
VCHFKFLRFLLLHPLAERPLVEDIADRSLLQWHEETQLGPRSLSLLRTHPSQSRPRNRKYRVLRLPTIHPRRQLKGRRVHRCVAPGPHFCHLVVQSAHRHLVVHYHRVVQSGHGLRLLRSHPASPRLISLQCRRPTFPPLLDRRSHPWSLHRDHQTPLPASKHRARLRRRPFF